MPEKTPAYDPNAPRRVLVVEDETQLRHMLLRAIQEMGFDAEGVRSGEQALGVMKQRPAEMAVLDLNLPGMHGLEALEVMHERWPDTQVVILTGFGDLDAARKAIRLDVVDFLTKPCALGELEVALGRGWRRWLDRVHNDRLLPEKPERGPTEFVASPDQTLRDIERRYILDALERHDGNRTAVAAQLGISVRTLYYRLKEYESQGFYAC